jgi:hypothetical protein
MIYQEMGDWKGAGDSWSWEDAVRGICSTWSMLDSVFSLDHHMERYRAMT